MNMEPNDKTDFAQTSLPVHSRPEVERALDREKHSVLMERIFEMSDVVSVYSPNGKELWYRVASNEVTADDYRKMLDNRPDELGKIIRDENIEEWRKTVAAQAPDSATTTMRM